MSVKKSFSIFVIIVILTAGCVLFFSVDSSTWAMLKHADRRFISLAALLVVLGWSLDATKFYVLSRAAGERLSFKSTIEVVWINYFGCAITPMQSGGGPFQVYLLYKNGVSVGRSIAITLVRTLQVLFILGAVIPFAIITDPDLLKNYTYIKIYMGYVVIFISGCAFLVGASLFRPNWIKHWVSAVLLWLNKIKLLKNAYLLRSIRWVHREVEAYNVNIRLLLSSGKWWFALSVLVAIVHLIVYMSIIPCLIKASGFSVDYIHCILAEALFIFMLYFVPTPGASGAAEGGAAAVFSIFVPWNVAGLLAITWRFISEYTGIFLGMAIAIKTIGWSGADKIMKASEFSGEQVKRER